MIGIRRLREPRTFEPRQWAFSLGLVVVLAFVAACVASPVAPPDPTPEGAQPSPRPTSPSTWSTASSDRATDSASPATPAASGVTPVRVTVGGQVFSAELYDNPTARDLADQLPLTVTVDDLHGLEKTGRLPRALTADGVPAGSEPEINEIGYYAPGRDLVLYYGDVGYYTGIIRIGRFQDSIDAIADQPDGVAVTVERD
jgi:hypothetical protein